ncbi:hypothetical protein HJG60_011192 [Phyllostomus discolor]|nr:hypothetical protein HJG60_011192 [Phyllostomus discolor]
MFICPQEMTGVLQKIAVQIEITQTLVIQKIMRHHQEIILNVITVFPIHMMTIHQEAVVVEMAVVMAMAIQIIHVAGPTGIHMTVTTSHAVLLLHEGPSLYGGNSRSDDYSSSPVLGGPGDIFKQPKWSLVKWS